MKHNFSSLKYWETLGFSFFCLTYLTSHFCPGSNLRDISRRAIVKHGQSLVAINKHMLILWYVPYPDAPSMEYLPIYIYHKNCPNVGKYSIHGAYGIYSDFKKD